ncbi:DUF7507 domain-containing protein [Lentzea sp. E54]|uniref:DUF7507 domain-containing protein n=1 Tax=Lentzea xerophila TaxID=3435883 RepID=UPI003DA25848
MSTSSAAGTPADADGVALPGGAPVADSDLTHHVGVRPAVDVEKFTNGQDADEEPGPQLVVPGMVVWTYVVRNTGDTNLVGLQVTDDREGTITCPRSSLSAGEQMTCTRTGTTRMGFYRNTGAVSGTPADAAGAPLPGIAAVADTDLSHYRGTDAGQPPGLPSIDLNKLVNGQDADKEPGQLVMVGSLVTWSYVVTNTGATNLVGVEVSDDREGAITCPKPVLAKGESMTCTHTATVRPGQYRNVGTVTATAANDAGLPYPGVPRLTDSDTAHHYGINSASVRLQKATNGVAADTAPGPEIAEGSQVTWTYEVVNTGFTRLAGIVVTDDREGVVTCPRNALGVSESMTCTHTGTARSGPYANTGVVSATPADENGSPMPGQAQVTSSDVSHYTGIQSAAPSVAIQKLVNGEDADASPGPAITAGGQVTWTYVVTNTGTTPLTAIAVTDDREGAVPCPRTSLNQDERMTCTLTGTVQAGPYRNRGTVTASPASAGGAPLPGTAPVSDVDEAHHFGAVAGVDIEKSVNGEDADVASSGPHVAAGDPVTWSYSVRNTGNTTLADIAVADDREGQVRCPRTTLAAGESMTCELTSVAAAGPYMNVGSVQGVAADATGAPLAGNLVVTDTDSAHHFGVAGSLVLETLVNAQDADVPTGPFVPAGSAVTWTYVVTNNGNVDVAELVVSDDQAGVIDCPATALAAGRSMTCSRTATARPGQHVNIGSVVATPVDGTGTPLRGIPDVSGSDPAHHRGASPGIDIEKAVNGEDADTGSGPPVPAGSVVTWTYVVTNTGNTPLSGVEVTDEPEGVITCPRTSLAETESMTCTLTGTVEVGPYANIGKVVGLPTDLAGEPVPGAPPVTDADAAHHFGTATAAAAVDIEKSTNGHDADIAPGPSITTGSTVTWTYVITNTGGVDLTDIAVVDDREGVIVCPGRALSTGEAMTCTATGTARAGQYVNTGSVTARRAVEVVAAAAVGAADVVSDSDLSHYRGESVTPQEPAPGESAGPQPPAPGESATPQPPTPAATALRPATATPSTLSFADGIGSLARTGTSFSLLRLGVAGLGLLLIGVCAVAIVGSRRRR